MRPAPSRTLFIGEHIAADYAEIPLRKRDGSVREHTLVDVSDYVFKALRCSLTARGYVQCGTPDGQRYLHREVLSLRAGDGLAADHVDGRPLDNRRSNLRPVTQAQNNQNVAAQRGSVSAHRGVSLCPDTGRWRARAGSVWLGRFGSEQEAADAASRYRAASMTHANEARYG